ncbi:Serine/threonine protein phosphatase 2A 55 kDa regulatory subunit B beta isoform [Acorus calamus]|uniref:Serine/threonine-protein phosphatase 2A 55 kDa regulatory subunit B n=1 Tax=Acorus calamus TaxID=4465 RepID=A0AAV9C8Q6_ACOCL|nr:Serine/threonine protein phosphatase 2A 55 kDa regulatory subunit B beta isoform [Acorus calamus]
MVKAMSENHLNWDISVMPIEGSLTLKSRLKMNGRGGGDSPSDASSPATPPPLDWRFSQVFGERAVGEEVQEVDIISAIEFDKSGDHLATGDRGVEWSCLRGRMLERDLEGEDYLMVRHPEFRYKTEFQSHEPEVQEKKVKKICEMNMDPSCSAENGSILSPSTPIDSKMCLANGGCSEKPYNHLNNDFSFPTGGFPSLRLPVVASQETSLVARCRRIYAHAHDYHINSISTNSDGETFISADDLRINLWNLEISNQSFNIVDVKPANMEDLTDYREVETKEKKERLSWKDTPESVDEVSTDTKVITSAEFHPTHCNTLAYSSSKGSIRLIDLRQSALCDTNAQLFEEHEAPGSRSFFTEIIASISDIKFGKDGRHILSRDYMTLKTSGSSRLGCFGRIGSLTPKSARATALRILSFSSSDSPTYYSTLNMLDQLWDINMDSGPVATFQVHEYLRPKLCDLYENDSIFDKFECCLSGDGLRVATGSYSNLFRIFGCVPGSSESTTLEASKNPMRRQVQNPARPARSLSSLTRAVRRGAESPGVEANGSTYDFNTKLLHLAWHPTENSIACAAANSLYMYYA